MAQYLLTFECTRGHVEQKVSNYKTEVPMPAACPQCGANRYLKGSQEIKK